MIPDRIDLIQPTGTRSYGQFRLGGVEVTIELPAHAVEQPGTSLDIMIDMNSIVLIDPDTGRVIGR